jgi:hypothetical protein
MTFGKTLQKLALGHIDKLPGGNADKAQPKDFDQRALAKGGRHEKEHTKDTSIAQEIAMDHLVEDPHYYKKLEKVEKVAATSFGKTLQKLAAQIGGGGLAPGGRYLTPRVVKRLAWQMGIPTDGNPAFDHFASHVTGTSDMKRMTQWQLHALVGRMPELQGAFTPVLLH